MPPPERKSVKKLIERAAGLAGLPSDGDWQANILFVGDRAMSRANREFVGHQGTTDVITFSYFDDPDSLFPGDLAVELIICADVAKREGEARDDSDYARELALYLSHGFLHAAGEDDLTPGPRRRMRRREREVLAALAEEFDFTEIFPSVRGK